MRIGFGLVMAMFVAHFAQAQVGPKDTNQELLRQCNIAVRVMDSGFKGTSEDLFFTGMCIGYTVGARDGILAPQIRSKNFTICLTGDPDSSQTARIVTKYLQQHPEDLPLHKFIGVEKALIAAFPCKR